MAYEDYCAACTYISEKCDSYGKYYCYPKGEDRYACDPKCYNFCEAYSRSNSARENMYENSHSHQSSGCYLTTTMCHILNYKDDNYYLQTLRTFRDQTLKKYPKYIPLLKMYDVIGPEISNNLYKDTNREIIAKTLFNGYITKVVAAIENEKVQESVNIYIAMTHLLAERYNINTNILFVSPTPTFPNTIDIESLGHARRKTKNSI